MPGATRAPHSSIINVVARAWASIACSGCRPFSNRPLASLRSPSFREVRWMLAPFHVAASISTRVVVPDTSLRAPPITPAIEVGPSPSAINTMSGSAIRVWPSRVSTGSFSAAARTISCAPAIRSRSNACSGCPVRSIT